MSIFRLFPIAIGLLAVALPVSPAAAKLLVRTIDGRVFTVNVSRHQVRAIVFVDDGGAPAPPSSTRLFHAVPRQDSGAFKQRRHHGLRVDTHRFDKIPYYLTNPVTRAVTVEPGQRCWLSGDPNAKRGWSVDNFILVELLAPGVRKRWVIGAVDPVRTAGGRAVARIGRNSLSFNAREIDLAPHLPKGVPAKLRFSALDYGGVGQLSDLFLVIR